MQTKKQDIIVSIAITIVIICAFIYDRLSYNYMKYTASILTTISGIVLAIYCISVKTDYED